MIRASVPHQQFFDLNLRQTWTARFNVDPLSSFNPNFHYDVYPLHAYIYIYIKNFQICQSKLLILLCFKNILRFIWQSQIHSTYPDEYPPRIYWLICGMLEQVYFKSMKNHMNRRIPGEAFRKQPNVLLEQQYRGLKRLDCKQRLCWLQVRLARHKSLRGSAKRLNEAVFYSPCLARPLEFQSTRKMRSMKVSVFPLEWSNITKLLQININNFYYLIHSFYPLDNINTNGKKFYEYFGFDF